MTTSTYERLFEDFPATSAAEWRKAAEESLKGAPFEKKLVTRTPEGIDLQPIYSREDGEKLALKGTWPGLEPDPPGGKSRRSCLTDAPRNSTRRSFRT